MECTPLLYDYDINDRGEIVGVGFDQNTGDAPAFLAIPSHNRGHCKAGSSAAQKIVLPENVSERLQQRRGFGGFGVRLMGPE
jgi:hypothetical protein